ncbi:MAG TPA: hypothetical protein ENN43_05475 [bacterium]|nr:hypothetical protein [bacterium]
MRINWDKISIKKLALIVSKELLKNDISAVLVGGACVSIYSRNKYFSLDLDFVSDMPLKELDPVMKTIGFKRTGRYYKRPGCRLFVEFPPPPVSIGHEFPIRKFNKIQTLVLLTSTDCVKDRLAAYYHWNDPESLKQALLVAQAQRVDMKNIENWSQKEGAGEKFERFKTLLYKTRKPGRK